MVRVQEGDSALGLVRRIEGGSADPAFAWTGVQYGSGFWPCRTARLSEDSIGMIAEASSPSEQYYWLFERTSTGWVAVNCARWETRCGAFVYCHEILSICTLGPSDPLPMYFLSEGAREGRLPVPPSSSARCRKNSAGPSPTIDAEVANESTGPFLKSKAAITTRSVSGVALRVCAFVFRLLIVWGVFKLFVSLCLS